MTSQTRALIVDDQYEKIEKIVAILLGAGLKRDDIAHVTTATDARKFLREKRFDLLILDMNLPATIGDRPQPDGGLELLKTMKLDRAVQLPEHVIGLTSHDDVFATLQQKMQSLSWNLYRYDRSDDAWSDALAERVAYLARRGSEGRLPSYKAYDIALMTALRDREFDAVLDLPCNWRALSVPDDPCRYFEGELPSPNGPLTVVASSALRMGMPSSAALAMKMAMTFTPKVLVMTGICAGMKSATNYGDIIVADPTWDWGSGKYKLGSEGKEFESDPHQRPLSASLRAKALDEQATGDLLPKVSLAWGDAVPAGKLKVVVGPVASGASVVAHEEVVKFVKDQKRSIVGIEMEAYAVMAAAEYNNVDLPAMVIKSVCDFADAKKNNRWQRYAAFTSARFFYHFFEKHGLER